MNVRAVSTWNCWGIPFGSPQLFERANGWRVFNDEQLLSLFDDYENETNSKIDESQDLIISTFQELFSFQGHSSLRSISRCCGDTATLISTILCLPCLWILNLISDCINCCYGCGNACYNTCINCCKKKQNNYSNSDISDDSISNNNNNNDNNNNSKYDMKSNPFCGYLLWDAPKYVCESEKRLIATLKHGIGINGESLSKISLIDAGLLILSNWKPNDYGFIPYKLKRGNERMANKGVLWAFYQNNNNNDDNNNNGTLVFTTHLTAKTIDKHIHLNEFSEIIQNKKAYFMSKVDKLEIIVTGDFNLDISQSLFDGSTQKHNYRDALLLKWSKDLNFSHISDDHPSNAEQLHALDHIFYWNSQNSHDKNDTKLVTKCMAPWNYSACNNEDDDDDDDDTSSNDYRRIGSQRYQRCKRKLNDLSDHCWKGVAIGKLQ